MLDNFRWPTIVPMASMDNLHEMIATVTKTFAIAHEKDTDAHLAQSLVYNAARLAWRLREHGLETNHKTSLSDVVTNADIAAEQFITGALALLRPEDGLLGEEGSRADGVRTWVIDPVDGTYNFTLGSDYWCSALALTDEEGAPLLGAVHRPAMGYTWFGGTDHPATRDGKEVSVHQGSAKTLCVSTYLHPGSSPADWEQWHAVIDQFASFRVLGSGSVDLASVADGSMGAWIQKDVAAWDWLPGAALVRAAGGVARVIGPWSVAGNPEVVDHIEEILLPLFNK